MPTTAPPALTRVVVLGGGVAAAETVAAVHDFLHAELGEELGRSPV